MTLLGARHDAGNAWSRLAPGATPSSGAVPSRRAISGAWSPQDGPGDRLFAEVGPLQLESGDTLEEDRKSTRLNSSHVAISYAVFCLKKERRPNRVSMRAQAPAGEVRLLAELAAAAGIEPAR